MAAGSRSGGEAEAGSSAGVRGAVAVPRGRLVVVAGPSGAGKGTIVAEALALCPGVILSISATTRPPRPVERDGVDYHFLSTEEFARREAEDAFFETAEVHGNRYGTLRATVQEAVDAGKTVLLEIDVQGARAVRRACPDAVLVFIEPPSPEALRARLEARGTEPPEVLKTRLANSARELEAAGEFDYRIVNDDLRDAVRRLIRILEGT